MKKGTPSNVPGKKRGGTPTLASGKRSGDDGPDARIPTVESKHLPSTPSPPAQAPFSDATDPNENANDSTQLLSPARSLSPSSISSPVSSPSAPSADKPVGVGNVKVAVRIRPPRISKQSNDPSSPSSQSQTSTVRVKPGGTTAGLDIVDPSEKGGTKEFAFDEVFSPEDGQEVVYRRTVRPLLERCLQGPYNGCIFCYGQTSSGKTYTMGTSPSETSPPGIIQYAAKQIIDHVGTRRRESRGEVEFKVRATYLEIYQETLTDLLLPKGEQGELRIRQDPDSPTGKDLYVEGISERSLMTEVDYDRLLAVGQRNRTVAETNMNEASSRSHAVLTIYIEESLVVPSTDDDSSSSISSPATMGRKRFKIHLIDLAGSERADSTGATGARLKEGSAINQSLSALGNVINALTSSGANGKRSHVPYRDSKLTYLLSDSLGSNAVTLMLACASPSPPNYSETLGTLRFAERVKKVKNMARVQMDANTMRILELEALIRELQQRITLCTCGKAKVNMNHVGTSTITSSGQKPSFKTRFATWWRHVGTSCGCTGGHSYSKVVPIEEDGELEKGKLKSADKGKTSGNDVKSKKGTRKRIVNTNAMEKD